MKVRVSFPSFLKRQFLFVFGYCILTSIRVFCSLFYFSMNVDVRFLPFSRDGCLEFQQSLAAIYADHPFPGRAFDYHSSDNLDLHFTAMGMNGKRVPV